MRVSHYLMVSFLFVVSASQVFAAPNIEFEQTTFNFGEVFQGDKVRHVFHFGNLGEDTLKIDRVRSSCGCTAVLVSEKSLAPNGRGEIQANFDSTRFRGNVSKTIYVHSNDPETPIVKLFVKGKVTEIVAVEPAQVNFGPIPPDTSRSASVTLRNQSPKPLSFGKPKTTAEELQARMPEMTLAQGEEITLEMVLSPKPGKSRFSGYVIVPVAGIPKGQLRIPVYATFR